MFPIIRIRNAIASMLCLLAMLAGCGGGGGGGGDSSGGTGGGTPPAPVAAAGQRLVSSIFSAQLGQQYNLQIYLPAGYQASSQVTYPVIYALDGDFNFATMGSALDGQGIKAILVGIGRSDRRDYDYNIAGSFGFYSFITLDLMPFIEAEYRAKSTNRTLVGHSFGGMFVGLALFMDRGGGKYFSNFVSLEGTYSIDPSTVEIIAAKEQALFDGSGGRLPVTMILAGANCCYYQAAQNLYNKLQSRHYPDFTGRLLQYNETHGGMFAPAFADSMRILFP